MASPSTSGNGAPLGVLWLYSELLAATLWGGGQIGLRVGRPHHVVAEMVFAIAFSQYNILAQYFGLITPAANAVVLAGVYAAFGAAITCVVATVPWFRFAYRTAVAVLWLLFELSSVALAYWLAVSGRLTM